MSIPQDLDARIVALEQERQNLLQAPYNRNNFQAYQDGMQRSDRLKQIEQALQRLFAEKRQSIAERHGVSRNVPSTGWEQMA
jgi:hypothetical protein